MAAQCPRVIRLADGRILSDATIAAAADRPSWFASLVRNMSPRPIASTARDRWRSAPGNYLGGGSQRALCDSGPARPSGGVVRAPLIVTRGVLEDRIVLTGGSSPPPPSPPGVPRTPAGIPR